jgi:hypothetical protein
MSNAHAYEMLCDVKKLKYVVRTQTLKITLSLFKLSLSLFSIFLSLSLSLQPEVLLSKWTSVQIDVGK